MIVLTTCDHHAHIVGDLNLERDGKILDVDAWFLEHGEVLE